jgi:DNA polymerase
MASFIFKKSYSSISKAERQLGKATILGAGYSMGADKFRDTCSKAPYNIDLSKEEAKEAIDTYRDIHAPVKDFWYACDRAAKAAINAPGSVHRVGKVAFKKSGDFLYIQLPSRRKLAYYKPSIEVVEKDWGLVEQIMFYGVDQETKKWGKISTYGGKLVAKYSAFVRF